MNEKPFIEVVKSLYASDSRYSIEAYFFVREALDFTTNRLKRAEADEQKHISGPELLEGIRIYALQEFGPMTLSVLNSWGIAKTDDFGEIVFNLVNTGKLGKTDEDSINDFKNVYDFNEKFSAPFVPASLAKGNSENDNTKPSSSSRKKRT